MPSRSKSEAAIANLKSALVRQYGASTRELVDACVDGRMAGRSRLEREDLDAIEAAVLSASRQRRTGGGFGGSMRKVRSSSTPNLSAQQLHQLDTTRPLSVATPSTGKRRATPKQRPLSMAGVGRQTFSGPLSKSVPTKPFVPNPPYGLVVSSTEEDDITERSCVVVRPRFPIPPKHLMKPVDHWDLIVAFDSEKYRKEQEAQDTSGKEAYRAKAKGMLDEQMREINAIRDEEAAERRKEKADMDWQIEENKRVHAAEQAEEHRKMMLMKKANDDMTVAIEERKKQSAARKKRQEEDMTNWLAAEKERKETEERELKEEYARKCKQARENMEAAAREAERRRLEREEEERRMVAEMMRVMDANEAKKKAELQAREDAVAARMASCGEQVAKRDKEEEQALEERLRKEQEEGDRLAEEDQRRRQAEHARKVQEMKDVRAKQIAERDVGQKEREQDKLLAAKWKKDCEDNIKEEQAKEEKKKHAREKLDQQLIDQIRERGVVHPQHYVMTPDVQQRELLMNRILFESMEAEGFQPGVTKHLLNTVKAKTGKLDPYPSVGRYEGPIHDLEFHEPVP